MRYLRFLSPLTGLMLVFLIIPSVRAMEPGPYLDFAYHLFEERDYYRTITEAKRFLFLNPDSPREYDARLLIARAYFEAGQKEAARDAFKSVAVQKKRPDLAAEALADLGRCLEVIDEKQAQKYYLQMSDNPPLPEESADDFRNYVRYRQGWVHLNRGRWAEAQAAFDTVDEAHSLKSAASLLSEKTLEAYELPYRSPLAAGFMSAVLPGAGQLYAGRPTDALLAFGSNALFTWGAVEAYQSEKWALFGLVGLFEVAWYGGNIYNAVNGAHIYNRNAREAFLKPLRNEYGFHLGYAPKQDGLTLSFTKAY